LDEALSLAATLPADMINRLIKYDLSDAEDIASAIFQKLKNYYFSKIEGNKSKSKKRQKQ
jgi:hypothetical protein